MSKINLTLFLSALCFTTLLQANEEAKELFKDANCMECHTDSHFKHRENKVNSYKKLSNSVNACANNSDAGWFDEDAESVTKYLNKKHYHYKEPEKKEED